MSKPKNNYNMWNFLNENGFGVLVGIGLLGFVTTDIISSLKTGNELNCRNMVELRKQFKAADDGLNSVTIKQTANGNCVCVDNKGVALPTPSND